MDVERLGTGGTFDQQCAVADVRETAMREVRRILAAGGALHLVDFGGGIPDLLRRAGFTDVTETGSDVCRHVGRFSFYRALT